MNNSTPKKKRKGVIKNFSPKPDENYYGLLIQINGAEEWFNGGGDIEKDWSKGDTVIFEHHPNEFIDMHDVTILPAEEENKEDADTRRAQTSDTGTGGGSKSVQNSSSNGNFSMTAKDKRILVQTAGKEAGAFIRENTDLDPVEDQGELLDLMSELTNGVYNLLEAQIKDKVNQ